MRTLRKSEVICPECRQVFTKRREDQRFHSSECRVKFFKRFKKKVKKIEAELQQDEYYFKKEDGSIVVKKKIQLLPAINCMQCEKPFIPMINGDRFCTHMCRLKYDIAKKVA
jgi:hypothetical protein